MTKSVCVAMSDALYEELSETASRSGCAVAEYVRRSIGWALYGACPDVPDREEEE